MSPPLLAAWHLVQTGVTATLDHMGTTALAVASGLVLLFFLALRDAMSGGMQAVKEHWGGRALFGLVLTITIWLGLFVYCIAAAIYQDHEKYVASLTMNTANQHLITDLQTQLAQMEFNLKQDNLDLLNEKTTNARLEKQLSKGDEYAYSLSLDSINQNFDVANKLAQIVIVFRNSLAKPIQYEISHLSVNGEEQLNFSVRKQVISAQSLSTFYTAFFPVEPNSGVSQKLELSISYGRPGQFTRKAQKAMQISGAVGSVTRYLYLTDNDSPIRGH